MTNGFLGSLLSSLRLSEIDGNDLLVYILAKKLRSFFLGFGNLVQEPQPFEMYAVYVCVYVCTQFQHMALNLILPPLLSRPEREKEKRVGLLMPASISPSANWDVGLFLYSEF